MNTRKAWILYAVLRLAFFAVPFALLMLLGWYWWAAALVATLVAASLSVILLSRLRETAAKGVYDWRHQGRTADDIVEDEAIETAESLEPVADTDDRSVSGAHTDDDSVLGAHTDDRSVPGAHTGSDSGIDSDSDSDSGSDTARG